MRKLRNVVFCIGLGLASLSGMRMDPEQIDELLAAMSQPKITHVLQEEYDDGDDVSRFKIKL